MTGRRRVILLDTNIIIEAVRTSCWNGLRGQYHLVTVEKCREEVQSGGHRTRGYVVVEDRHLGTGIDIVEVTERDRVLLTVACADAVALDDGERDLWAHANSREGDWEAACADQAAVRIAMQLGWGDQLVSLEELVVSGGIRPRIPLKGHYTSKMLRSWRTRFRLDN